MINIVLDIPPRLLDMDLTNPTKKSLRQSVELVRRSASIKAPYKTGNLRRSIKETVEGMRGIVGTNVVYAAIHEYGGTITPVKEKYLTFKVNGSRVRVKSVKIPKRPYLRPALEENRRNIINTFKRNYDLYLQS